MDKQDMKQNGIDWLVEEIGHMRVKYDNSVNERVNLGKLLNSERVINSDLELEIVMLKRREAELTRDLENAKYDLDKANSLLADGFNTHGFPRIITTSETTLSGFVRQLDCMIGWVGRRLQTAGVVDVEVPGLINDLRNLAGNTRKLYHKMETQLDIDKQAQQPTTNSWQQQYISDLWKSLYNSTIANVSTDEVSGIDELQKTLDSVYEAFGFKIDKSEHVDKNCMVAKNEDGEVIWVMYW